MNESAQGRITDMFGLERDDAGRLKDFDAAQEGLNLLQKSISPVQTAFADMWQSIADGSMTAGEAAEAFALKSLKAFGSIAINEGSAMLFKAIPAAIENPPLGIAYGVGGAGLIALGVGLGAAANAATPPKALPAGAGADSFAARANRRDAPSSRDSIAAPINITMESFVPAGPADANRLRSNIERARRQGFEGTFPKPARL